MLQKPECHEWSGYREDATLIGQPRTIETVPDNSVEPRVLDLTWLAADLTMPNKLHTKEDLLPKYKRIKYIHPRRRDIESDGGDEYALDGHNRQKAAVALHPISVPPLLGSTTTA